MEILVRIQCDAFINELFNEYSTAVSITTFQVVDIGSIPIIRILIRQGVVFLVILFQAYYRASPDKGEELGPGDQRSPDPNLPLYQLCCQG